jgi:DNA-binding NtrC family response regulator
LILLDVMLPGVSGFETCRRLKQDAFTRDIPVIFLTAREEPGNVVEGFRAGGVDYITKPFRTEEVLSRVHTHLTLHRRTEELRRKTEELEAEIARRHQAEASFQQASQQLSLMSQREAERWGLAGLVGESPTLRRILADIHKLHRSGTRTNVLITGESGTGKELIARAVHYGGPRGQGPFLVAACSALPSELVESILLGHVKGAFTGASTDRKGYFELAHGGSLFLDEIADMPLSLQAKLLRVLETGIVTPVGSAEERPTDVQVIAATNAELPAFIELGKFRQDLYFRLARFTIEVPPLRERREDIPLLLDHFLRLLASEMGVPRPELSPQALDALRQYDYPGNVRELKNLVERALIETAGARIELDHLHFVSHSGHRKPDPPAQADRSQHSGSTDEERIVAFLEIHRSINNTECRDLLGVGLQRACYLLRKLHLSGTLERDSSGRWAQYRLSTPRPPPPTP